MTDNGNAAPSAEEDASRIASIPAKRTLKLPDSGIAGPSASRDEEPDQISVGSKKSFPPANTRPDDDLHRDFIELEDDTMDTGNESEDEYTPDVLEEKGDQKGSETRKDVASRVQDDAIHSKRFPGVDLTAPIADILDQLPSVKEYSTGESTKIQNQRPYRENIAYVKRLTAAIHAYREARNLIERSKKRLLKRQERASTMFDEAEVRLAWCLYYPLHQPWVKPPPAKLPESTSEFKETESQRAKQRFLEIVQKSLEQGTLTELREGKLGGVNIGTGSSLNNGSDKPTDTVDARQSHDEKDAKEALREAKESVRQAQKVSEQSQKHTETISSLELRIDNLEHDIRYCSYFPTNRSYEPLRDFKRFGESVQHAEPSIDGSPAQLWKLMSSLNVHQLREVKAGRYHSDTSHADKLPALGNASQAPTSKPHELAPEEINNKASPNDGSDDAEIEKSISSGSDRIYTNIESDKVNSKSESGEISSITNGTNTPEEGLLNGDHHPAPNNGSMQDFPQRGIENQKGAAEGKWPRVLQDLSSADLNAQMRYFHFMRDPSDVPPDEPVRCLCCGKIGHVAEKCEHLLCSKCGAFNLHMSIHCDDNPKCTKCREKGHQASNCPYKLRNLSISETKCDLCNREGHLEGNCELLWRTAGAPWQDRLILDLTKVSCYECGASGHLGNDCYQRQPGKSMGTSTWSLESQPPKEAASRPRSIRGAASRHQVSNRSEVPDDDPRAFQRTAAKPPLPKPTTKGTIRIDTKISGPTATNLAQPQAPGNSKKRPRAPSGGADTRAGPLKTTHNPASRSSTAPNDRLMPGPRVVQRGPDPFPRGAAFNERHALPPVPPPWNPINRPQYQDSHRYPDYEADMQYQYNHQPPPPPRGPPPPTRYESDYRSYNQGPPPPSQRAGQAGQAQLGRYPVRTPHEEVRYHPMPSSAQQNLNRFRR